MRFICWIFLKMDESPEKYGSSSKSRPSKITKGGKGVYCCVPACSSAFYNSENEKTGIGGFFKFPKDPSRQRTWKRIINQYRRKGSGDTFNIKSRTVVCEFHFKADEIKVYITW